MEREMKQGFNLQDRSVKWSMNLLKSYSIKPKRRMNQRELEGKLQLHGLVELEG